jgi:dimethylargininase
MNAISYFTQALCRRPAETVADGLTTQNIGKPDLTKTMAQYDAYIDALRACGLSVIVLPADAAYPDGHYVEDTAILYGDLAVITQPGHASRRHEPRAIASALPQENRVAMNGEAYLDGGDVLFCADRVLIGLSSRTNRTGAEQLRNALCELDSKLKVEFVPVSGVLHLKTGMTELAPGVLLCSRQMYTDHDFTFAEVVTLSPQESYAANVLPINGTVLIPKGFPTVQRLAEQHYTNVIELDMSEFEKMDGSLTCLSLRYNAP